MILKKWYIYLFYIVMQTNLFAQDIHWTQFNQNPLFQNPSHAGSFKGDFRFISNYRNQWRSVTVPYSSFNFSYDQKINSSENLGVGFTFFNDNAGDGKFKTIELQSNLSYRIKISKQHLIRTGLNIGMNHRQINFSLLSFNNQYNGVTYDAALNSNETFTNQQNTNLSIGLGATYYFLQNEKEVLSFGLACFNINQPNQGFYNQTIKRDIRYNLFIKGQRKINTLYDILPSFQLNFQGTYKEIILGSSFKYTMVNEPRKYRATYIGAWFRNKDAILLTGGIDNQNWFAGVSYDINISKLVPASHFRGGFELSVRYIITSLKPKKIIHRICPDYI